ncbi:unnamed protein product [Boreogadus saida]
MCTYVCACMCLHGKCVYVCVCVCVTPPSVTHIRVSLLNLGSNVCRSLSKANSIVKKASVRMTTVEEVSRMGNVVFTLVLKCLPDTLPLCYTTHTFVEVVSVQLPSSDMLSGPAQCLMHKKTDRRLLH